MPESAAALRRNRLLNQMGIAQYELRRPAALRGEVAVAPPEHIRLIVIAAEPSDSDSTLFLDIIHSMSLTPAQVYGITAEQAVMLPENQPQALWLIGDVNLPAPLAQRALLITSPSLAQLNAEPASKRELWRQICHHENYFTLNA